MIWQELLERPELQNLPFKIELNAKGKIEMSPATNIHGLLQGEIAGLLRDFLRLKGHVITECSIQTTQGVKVADVTWVSKEMMLEYKKLTPFPSAPVICIEIIGPSNSTAEILEKIGLYFQGGAREVWTCNLEGQMRFYDSQGGLVASGLVPEFPKLVIC